VIVYLNQIFTVHTNTSLNIKQLLSFVLNIKQLLSFVVDPISFFKNMHLKMLNRSKKKEFDHHRTAETFSLQVDALTTPLQASLGALDTTPHPLLKNSAALFILLLQASLATQLLSECYHTLLTAGTSYEISPSPFPPPITDLGLAHRFANHYTPQLLGYRYTTEQECNDRHYGLSSFC